MSWHSDDRARTPWADDDALGSDLVTAVAEADLYDRVLAGADLAFRAHRGMVDARAGLEMDLMLLELVYDSGALDAPVGVRDRSGGSSRTLVFEGDALGVEVEVETASIEGQLIPPRPGPRDPADAVRRRRVGRHRRRRVLPVRRPARRAAAAGVQQRRGHLRHAVAPVLIRTRRRPGPHGTGPSSCSAASVRRRRPRR